MPLTTMDLEFTPSEVDALEAIPPPTPPPPPRSPRYFPPGDPHRPVPEPGQQLPLPLQRRRGNEPSNPGQTPRAERRIAVTEKATPPPPPPPPPPRGRAIARATPARPPADKPKRGPVQGRPIGRPCPSRRPKSGRGAPPKEERTHRPCPSRRPRSGRGAVRGRRTRRPWSKVPPARPGQGTTAAPKRPRGRPRKDGTGQ